MEAWISKSRSLAQTVHCCYKLQRSGLKVLARVLDCFAIRCGIMLHLCCEKVCLGQRKKYIQKKIPQTKTKKKIETHSISIDSLRFAWALESFEMYVARMLAAISLFLLLLILVFKEFAGAKRREQRQARTKDRHKRIDGNEMSGCWRHRVSWRGDGR